MPYNHYDPAFDYPNHIGHINYLDIDNLKGDTPARIMIEIDDVTPIGCWGQTYIARRTRGSPCAFTHFREAEDAAIFGWNIQADPTCSDGSKLISVVGVSGEAGWDIANPSKDLMGRFRLMIRVKCSNPADTKFYAKYGIDDVGQITQTPKVVPTLTDQWEGVDLGVIHFDTPAGAPLPKAFLLLVWYEKGMDDVVEFDCLILLPEGESMLRLDCYDFVDVAHHYDQIGDFENWCMVVGDRKHQPSGAVAHLELAPDRENRLVFLGRDYLETSKRRWPIEHEVEGQAMKVKMSYLPQYVSPLA